MSKFLIDYFGLIPEEFCGENKQMKITAGFKKIKK